MDRLEQRLESLDPPVKHILRWEEDGLQVTLIDPSVPARVVKMIRRDSLSDVYRLNLTLLYAVNELRAKGSLLPLSRDTVLVKAPPVEVH